MRILHVVSTLAPAEGGPTQVLSTLPPKQADLGHQVTVCTTDRNKPVDGILPDSYFLSLYPKSVNLRVFPVSFGPLLVSPQMGRWLRANISCFDLVHIHGLYRFPSTFAASQARRQRIPYIIRPHGSLDPYLYGKSSRSIWLKRQYERWFDLPNLHAATAIHYTSDEERDRASHLQIQARSFVVPNGLDWSQYCSLPARGGLRRRWKIGTAPTVLFLGRLHFKKGLDLLIPAFDAVRRQIPDAQLVIAGPENDAYGLKVRDWVRKSALDEAVHFVGSLERPEVVQAYVDADVFVLPSYTENFGMAVAEAMACATPVVISDQVNIHRDVLEVGAGLVTHCGAAQVAEALSVLLQDAELRAQMGAAGRKLVQTRYTWSVVAPALNSEYLGIVERVNRRQGAPLAGCASDQVC